MVKATTPQKQMEAFREEGLRVRGRLEARKLVERITTEIKIWETRLSCSKERLSDTEEMLQRLGESFTERHREEVLRRDMVNVQSAKKDFKAFEKSASALIYPLEAKYGLDSDSDDSAENSERRGSWRWAVAAVRSWFWVAVVSCVLFYIRAGEISPPRITQISTLRN